MIGNMSLFHKWMFGLRIFGFVAGFALITMGCSAADANARFESANKLYEQGHYAEAVKIYDQLIAAKDVSEAVYFNLGNAYFKMGQLGRAVVAYRQAQRLAPRDHDLRANLQLARTRARGGAPYQSDRLRGWLGSLTLNEWALLTAAALWAFFICLALGQWRVKLKERLKNYLVAAGGAVVLFGVCFGVVLYFDYLAPTAIVTAGEAEVHNGPFEESPGVFKVRDGLELRILDRKENWLQVQDPAQRIGWLRRDQALIFDSTGIHAPKT